MIISDMDMVCIAERADGKGKVEGYYFCLHHNDGRTHLHHLIIPLEADLSRGTPLDQIQVEVVPKSITPKVQAPRVLTLEEVKNLPAGTDVWIQHAGNFADDVIRAATVSEVTNASISFWFGGSLYYMNYGEKPFGWICWTSRPTDEQRKAVNWDG